MIKDVKPAVWWSAGVLAWLVGMAAFVTWALPGPRRAFDYMVVGTLATGLALAALFVYLVRRRV
ncbi:MAG TPA: hypothetical protein VG675_12305 [Bryobacteraceae bacterium]|nr:hypothetical protein [Bryobacteraceae bacterium]